MTLLLKYWRELLILILAAMFIFSVQTCQRNKQDKEAIQEAHDSTFNMLKVYRSKNNELITQVKTHAYTIQQIRDDNGILGIENDKLRKQIGNLNNLVGFWKGKARVVDTFTVMNHDTVVVENGVKSSAMYFEYDNHYLKTNGIVTDKETILSYDYHFDFKLTPYWRSKGFLKKKELVTDVTFSDPNLKVKEFTGVVVRQPKKQVTQTNGFWAGVGALLAFILASR